MQQNLILLLHLEGGGGKKKKFFREVEKFDEIPVIF